MKTKLHALIAEQKALTAKFEELLSKPDIHKKKGTLDYRKLRAVFDTLMETYTTEELIEYAEMITQEQSVNPKKVYIKGHSTRGAEVIKMLEDLGGVNNKDHNGKLSEWVYLIIDGNIWASTCSPEDYTQRGYTELHLPEEVNEVDSQTKEIALIEGEVYENEDGCVWIHEHLDVSDSSSVSICGLDNKGNLHLQGWFSLGGLKKSAKKELLFDIIKDNNKHFDKENMRLLDVEEWSCEKGLPIIVRNETTNWRADIFHSYDSVDAKYPYCCNSSDECDRLYRYAMPYTEENIYFIGTNNSPDKHYKFIEK